MLPAQGRDVVQDFLENGLPSRRQFLNHEIKLPGVGGDYCGLHKRHRFCAEDLAVMAAIK